MISINSDVLILLPPTNRVEEIAYQTVLPTYYATILEEYEKASPGTGLQIQELIIKEINYLHESQKRWNELSKGQASLGQWEEHISKRGWNVSDFKYP